MSSPGTVVEVLMQGAVESTEAFNFIVYGMGMDDIHKDRQAGGVGCVNQGLEVIRCSKAGRGRKKIGYLITERAVVGMLLNRH